MRGVGFPDLFVERFVADPEEEERGDHEAYDCGADCDSGDGAGGETAGFGGAGCGGAGG